MRQYIPWGRAKEFSEINRHITDEEYAEAVSEMECLGIVDGYVQERILLMKYLFLPLMGMAY